MTTTISVDPGHVLGDVSPLVYGHFTEHLSRIVYDGLWSEQLYGRKFEAPMVHRVRHTMAQPWEPFQARTDKVVYGRAPMPLGRYASPQAGAHHSQAVATEPGHDGSEVGLAQPEVVVDAGVTYTFRAKVRRLGPADTLRVALRAADGVTVLGEASITVAPFTASRFGDSDVAPQHLWMDDLSYTEVETTITATGSDPDGWITLTFTGDEPTAWWFDWVSLMPADNINGWHRTVVDELRALPAQSLKWPGGCMADSYDWRLGIGPRDDRYGYAEQAWAAWDENDVGTEEFLDLCQLTGAEPIIGVNAGTGTPELAAAWVEHCAGRVKYWCIGNEQWGFFERGYVGPEAYARRYLAIAEAMRKVDASITLVAVGQPGEFNRTVLQIAAPMIDMLQIHHYTPEHEPEVTDAASAARKIATARTFDTVLQQVADDIASVPGASHVKVCLDEWGWGRAGQAGALFNAAVLNAFHRAAPLVSIGSRATVINVDGILERDGADVRRGPAYDIFKTYSEKWLPKAVAASVDGPDAETIDVSCLADPDTGRRSLFIVNGGPATDVTIAVAGEPPEQRTLPALSLTVVEAG